MWPWILGGLAVLGGGLYVATRDGGGEAGGADEGEGEAGTNGGGGKGAGWYVLLYDRVGQGSSTNSTYDKLPDGRRARLKEYSRHKTKEQAVAEARLARAPIDDGGSAWTGKDVRVVVEYRGRAPWLAR